MSLRKLPPGIHVPQYYDIYIFPIKGMILKGVGSIDIGHVKFMSKTCIEREIIKFKNSDFLINNESMYNSVFALVDIKKYGKNNNLTESGTNSLALQVCKQAIGGIYVGLYKKHRKKLLVERRIMISNDITHELDEGLVPYFVGNISTKEIVYFDNRYNPLNAIISDSDEKYFLSMNNLLSIPFKERNQYQNKLCKSLEIIYQTFNEIYTNERIFKFVMILNHIFRDTEKLDSNDIARRIRILFDIISHKKIVEEKIQKAIPDIFSRLRNDPIHGILDPFEEVCLIHEKDYKPLKRIVMETIVLLIEHEELSKLKTTKELNDYIFSSEKEFIRLKKQN